MGRKPQPPKGLFECLVIPNRHHNAPDHRINYKHSIILRYNLRSFLSTAEHRSLKTPKLFCILQLLLSAVTFCWLTLSVWDWDVCGVNWATHIWIFNSLSLNFPVKKKTKKSKKKKPWNKSILFEHVCDEQYANHFCHCIL